MHRVLPLALLLASTFAHTDDNQFESFEVSEIWNCYDSVNKGHLAASLFVPKFGQLTAVLIGGEEYLAQYQSRGSDHLWGFGPPKKGDSFPYLFVINASGLGHYYNFGERFIGSPTATFQCFKE